MKKYKCNPYSATCVTKDKRFLKYSYVHNLEKFEDFMKNRSGYNVEYINYYLRSDNSFSHRKNLINNNSNQ